MMTNARLEALKESIAVWDLKAQGFGLTLGGTDCPLCKESGAICSGCPVRISTGFPFCRYTPYKKVADIFYAAKRPSNPADFPPDLWDAVEEEIEFLISLLPEKEREVYGY